MKKFILITATVLSILKMISCSHKQPSSNPEQEVAQLLLVGLDSFNQSCNELKSVLQQSNAADKTIQSAYLKCRLAYKKVEWAVEYSSPTEATKLNGAPVPEIEINEEIPGEPPAVIEAEGLQVMEPNIFPKYKEDNKQLLDSEINQLILNSNKAKTRFKNIALLNWQIFDATKLEVFRIITLGISGYDAPIAQNSIAEAEAALEFYPEIFEKYAPDEAASIYEIIKKAQTYLNTNTDFNQFDRAKFITEFANPLSTAIQKLSEQLKIIPAHYTRLLNQNANTLFDVNAFNPNTYVANFSDTATPEKIALGKALFQETCLSANNMRSCQSCHLPEKAYTDGLINNVSIYNKHPLPRNTPTLINAALQPSLFDDSRSNNLEDQVKKVVENKTEMDGSLYEAAKRLSNLKNYQTLFDAAFPTKAAHTTITPHQIQTSISAYIRSLVKLNSRFDEYMQGNKKAMSAQEIHGFNLFMGKAKCGTCHFAPIFNGNLPPKYARMESEIIGVPDRNSAHSHLDQDLGKYKFVKNEFNKNAFKTPTVRNAALTAPYMHNGVFATLEEVMDFYNKGGGNGLGLNIPNQTLPFDKLNLSQPEMNDIIAFIKSLNSKY